MEAIEYVNSIADAEAFSLYHSKHSHLAKRMMRAGRLSFSVTTLVVTLSITVPELGFSMGALVPAMICVIAVALLYPTLHARSMRGQVRRLRSSGKNIGVLGWHRLTLLDDELREENEGGSRRIHYEALEGVAESESHIFIYVTVASAYMIPKNAISSGALGSFLTSLRERMERASESSVPGFAA